MNKIGIIDIEAESITMTLAQTSDKGYFKIIDELKEYINIGSDILTCSIISDEQLTKTLTTLGVFKTMCLNAGTSEIIIIGSEAIKNSENQTNFTLKIKEILNMDIRILSNEEELYYNYLAVKNSMFIESSLLLDINGYSINLAYIENNIIKETALLPFGFISVSNKFDLNNNLAFFTPNNLKGFIENELNKYTWLQDIKFDSIIAVGNIANCIGSIDIRRKHYPLNIPQGYRFYLEDIKEIYNLVKSKDMKHRLQISGLKNCYASTILAASGILKLISEFTNTAEIDLCSSGLREGLLFEYLDMHTKNDNNILDTSLIGIMDSININTVHAEQVFKIASKLFVGLSDIHKINNCKYNRILKTSSLLHDSGISISYQNHHLHSFYVILNSNIKGLSHRELLMSAFASALHRNNDFTVPLCKYSSILNKLDVKNIEYIGVLIRIAEGLDRSLCCAIDDFDISITQDIVELKLKSNKNIELEIYEAYRSKDAFFEIYGKELKITKF